MQSSLDGSVNWTAPRFVPLAFGPLLGTACVLWIAALAAYYQPRAGQEHLVIPVNIIVALVVIGAHAFHLWLIDRTLRRGR